MKRILCFGDSNTWGRKPHGPGRFEENVRWGGVLRTELGAGYAVTVSGLGGRTTTFDDPVKDHLNGRRYLPVALMTHRPLDLVIIMLGTNDLKSRFSASAWDIAKGAGALIDTVRRSEAGYQDNPPNQILLIAPPPLNPEIENGPWAEEFIGGLERSLKLAAHYERVAEEHRVAFFDAGTVIETSPLDAVHLSEESHAKLGRAVAAEVRRLLTGSGDG